MVAAAMTGGDVLIRDAVWEHNRPLIAKLLEMGVEVIEEDEGIRVRSQLENLKAVHVKTLPPPRISNRYAGSIYSLDDS